EGLKEEPARKLVDIIHKYNAAGWVIVASVFEKDLENVNKFAAQKGMNLVLGTGESPDQEGVEQIIEKARRVKATWVAFSIEEIIENQQKIEKIHQAGLKAAIWSKAISPDTARKALALGA